MCVCVWIGRLSNTWWLIKHICILCFFLSKPIINRIEDSLRSVLVSAPDYKTLKIIHTARRLYRNKYISTSEKQDLSRRFAEGYKQLLLMTSGNPPQRYVSSIKPLHHNIFS